MTRAADDSFDAAAVLADDALLDALAAGALVENDPLGALLTRWRVEVVLATSAYTNRDPLVPDDAYRHRRRVSRIAAAVVAAALITSGGVAAAAVTGPSGPLGGLHRMIFGGAAHTDQNRPGVLALLDEAQRRIAAGQRVGAVAVSEHDAIAGILTRAEGLLRAHTNAPRALAQRLQTLRTDLARLPIMREPARPVTTPAPVDPGTRSTVPPLRVAPPTAHPGTAGTSESGDRDPHRGTDSHSGAPSGSDDSTDSEPSTGHSAGSDSGDGSGPSSGDSDSGGDSSSGNGAGSDSGSDSGSNSGSDSGNGDASNDAG